MDAIVVWCCRTNEIVHHLTQRGVSINEIFTTKERIDTQDLETLTAIATCDNSVDTDILLKAFIAATHLYNYHMGEITKTQRVENVAIELRKRLHVFGMC